MSAREAAPTARHADAARGHAAALWFALLAAPAAWSVHELVDYAVVARACFPATLPLAEPRFTATWAISFAVALACAGVALAALLVGLRLRRAYPPAAGHRFLASGGVLLSTIFAALILYSVIAMLIVPTCGY